MIGLQYVALIGATQQDTNILTPDLDPETCVLISTYMYVFDI